MGYKRHHMIIVSTSEEFVAGHICDFTINLDVTRAKAVEIFQKYNDTVLASEGMTVSLENLIGDVHRGIMNNLKTLVIYPCGGYAGGGLADAFDAACDEFIAWLETHKSESGGNHYEWVDLIYSDEWAEKLEDADRIMGSSSLSRKAHEDWETEINLECLALTDSG